MKNKTRCQLVLASLLIVVLVFADLSPTWAFQERAGADRSEDTVDFILEQVIGVRGLALLQPVQHGTSTRDEIRALLIQRIEMEYPREEILAEERALKMLRLIPEHLDLYEFMIELLTEQIAGYYDPLEARFLLADWVSAEEQEEVIAHELTHALQDQHFDLESILNADVNGDQALAYSSVIEGDGILTMLAYLLASQGRTIADLPDLAALAETTANFSSSEFKILAEAPLFLREVLLFPYSYGAQFVQIVVHRSGWEGLNKVYSDLPRSSEQILHPEKYLSNRDDPVTIEIDDFSEYLGPGWSNISDDTLGELGLLILLKEKGVGDEVSRNAAKGWGGDSYYLLEGPGGAEALMLKTAWDSEGEAEEFCRTYTQFTDGQLIVDRNDRKVWKDSSEVKGIRCDSSTVEIFLAPSGTELKGFKPGDN